ncbi:MAG: DivIVA domain-containing protein [Propionibacteriaceae bacterium]|jgi:DivIVA domain-containing protein|nr:DivIVA domain-containing protein [Propionibacteriaceae bacterium]
MEWFLAILAIIAFGVAAVASTGRLGQMAPAPKADRPAPVLPDGPLTSADLEAVKFAVTPRGYAMDQVDDLIDRLAAQLADARPVGERRRRVENGRSEAGPATPIPARAARRSSDEIADENEAPTPARNWNNRPRPQFVDEIRNHDGSDEASNR